LLAHDVLVPSAEAGVEAYLTFVSRDRVFGLDSGRLEEWFAQPEESRIYGPASERFAHFEHLEAAKQHFGTTYNGRTIGEWMPVPDEVGRSLTETLAWLVSSRADDAERSEGW
jgi:hypothetical protein